MDAPKSSTRSDSSARRALLRAGRLLFCCGLALSSARCVNDMVSVEDNYGYGSGGGYNTRPTTTTLGRNPDSVVVYVRQAGSAQPTGTAAVTIKPENGPGSAPAN